MNALATKEYLKSTTLYAWAMLPREVELEYVCVKPDGRDFLIHNWSFFYPAVNEDGEPVMKMIGLDYRTDQLPSDPGIKPEMFAANLVTHFHGARYMNDTPEEDDD